MQGRCFKHLMQVHSFGHLSFSDEGQRDVMFRTDMNEINIHPIDPEREDKGHVRLRLCRLVYYF